MNYPCFQANKALRLQDDDYYFFLMDKIRHASRRIYAAIFIVDLYYDRLGKIKGILEEMAYAKWRGLDIKMVLGHSDKNMLIDITDRLSFKYFRDRGIPVRFSNPTGDYSLHSKYVIFDDELVVVGSHNWSHLDIFMSKEDSAAVYSRDMAIDFANEFIELWNSGLEGLT